MTSRDKAAVVIVMWLIGFGLSLIALVGRPIDIWNALLVMAVIGSAVGGSIAITTGTKTIEQPRAERDAQPASRSKAKNEDMGLADRLIASMTDEEIAALRRRLIDAASIGDDGELVTLQDQPSGKRLRS
jgi:hypothetical protein